MDQTRTPLIDALRAFAASNQGYFNIPGHRGARGVDARLLELLGDRVFEADRTETDGLDDLHAADGAIREAQELAADLFGSAHCRFVVNGTTGANEAMILATAGPGDKILVPRNVHKSVMMGLVMSGAVPVWVLPEREEDTGLYGAVSPAEIEKALEREPEIRAVFLVSPTYYGTCSDVKTIAGIAHRHNVPLLVDEAHGAHFSFHEQLPPSALASGADLVAQSTHKTIGSLTQSAMLQINSSRIPLPRVDDALKLVQSTSPSYPLMASLDGARHLMAVHGEELQARAMKLASLCREELRRITGIEVFHAPEPHHSAAVYDPCRVVFSACSAGMTGMQLQQRLFRKQITTELADAAYLVLVVTHGNTEDEIRRFCAAVREIVSESAANANTLKSSSVTQKQAVFPVQCSEMILTPREAWLARKQAVLLQASCGLIAGEAVTPYPPGIPLIYPGERITEAQIEQLQRIRSMRIPVHDAADPELHTIRAINPKIP